MIDLPKPLINSEVDLREFDYMPLYGKRLFTSETWINADPEEKVAALRLWWASWHEEPAGSLPNNDRMLAELAGYGVAIKAFQVVKANAMRGWIECSDGRLYHPIVCEIAEESWKGKKKKVEENERDRARKAAKRSRLPADKQVETAKRPREKADTSTGHDVGKREVSAGQSVDMEKTSDGKTEMSDGQTQKSSEMSGGIPPENALKGSRREEKGKIIPSPPPSLDVPRDGSDGAGTGDKPMGFGEPDPSKPPEIQLIQAFDRERFTVYGPNKARAWPHPNDRTYAKKFLEAGADLELCRDVFAAGFRQVHAEGGEPPSSLRFFETRITSALAARKAPLKAPTGKGFGGQSAPRERTIEDRDVEWRGRMKLYREKGTWGAFWGPKPGQPGCSVPAEILAEFPDQPKPEDARP